MLGTHFSKGYSTEFTNCCVVGFISRLNEKIKSLGLSAKLIEEFEEEVKSLEGPEIEDIYNKIMEVSGSVKQLVSQDSKSEMKKSIKPLYLQMSEWFRHHIDFFGDLHTVNVFFRWKEGLVIDKKETAKTLIDGRLLDASKSYELACYYCLENDIKVQNLKKETGQGYVISHINIVKFWNPEVEDVKRIKLEDYEYLLECIVKDGNEVALEYFLNYLGQSGLKTNLVSLAVIAASTYSSTLPYNYYTPVLCKLLNAIDGQEKEKLYGICCYDVLNHLVSLDLEGYSKGEYRGKGVSIEDCSKIFDHVWSKSPSIPQNVCQTLLANIASKIDENRISCQVSFIKFWGKFGAKEGNNRVGKQLLPYLLQFDEENIKEVLCNATSSEKKEIADYVKSNGGLLPKYCRSNLLSLVAEGCFWDKKEFIKDLILSDKGLEICTYFISNDQFDEFKRLFSAAGEPNQLRSKLLESRGREIFSDLCVQDKVDLFSSFLNWCFSEQANLVQKFKQSLVLSYVGVETIVNAVSNNHTKYEIGMWQSQYVSALTKYAGSSIREEKLKEWFVSQKGVSDHCVYILLRQSDKLADEFLNWCFNNENKVNNFKKDFVSRTKPVDFCTNNIEAEEPHVAENFLEWVGSIIGDKELGGCRALLRSGVNADQEHEKTADDCDKKQEGQLKSTVDAKKVKKRKLVQSDSPKSYMQELRVKKVLYCGSKDEEKSQIVQKF